MNGIDLRTSEQVEKAYRGAVSVGSVGFLLVGGTNRILLFHIRYFQYHLNCHNRIKLWPDTSLVAYQTLARSSAWSVSQNLILMPLP